MDLLMACPRDSMAIQLLAIALRKKLATWHFRLSRLGVAPCTIGMSTSILAGNASSLRQLQKLFVRSFLAISFYVILVSFLLSV